MAEKIVDAVVLKDFTSTMFGNLTAGQIIPIDQHRFNVWQAQKLVDYPKGATKVVADDPEETANDAKPATTPKKSSSKRKKKKK